MAVFVKYVVVRDGKEDMMFSTKKEADAYDKMLDIAERLYAFLHTADLNIDDDKLDALTFFMARHHVQVGKLLKGGKLEPSDADLVSPQAPHASANGASATNETHKAPKRTRATRSRAASESSALQ